MAATLETCLVIGGCGFLGRHVVEALLARGYPVAVFDLVQRHFDPNIQFFTGDVADENAVGNAIRRSQATAVFHTVAPPAESPAHVHRKVNIEGTKIVISTCIENGVKYLIYTSSAGLVFDGNHIINVDERLPTPEIPMDAYNETKAIGEQMVLEANDKEGMKTVSLRPSGIFGPGDRQGLGPNTSTAVKNRQTRVQIGPNNNIADWTYVTNVAAAHILALEKLKIPETRTREQILESPLSSPWLSIGERRIPTSIARPIGPAMIRPENADELEAAFRAPQETEERAFVRSRYDPLSPSSLEKEPVDPLQVAGQSFIITNGEPAYFWDVPRAFYYAFGAPKEDVDKPKFVLPYGVGWFFAWATEWVCWLTGRQPMFTRLRVQYMGASRYFNIEKARRVLGYEPNVSLQDGIQKTVDWWKAVENEAARSR